MNYRPPDPRKSRKLILRGILCRLRTREVRELRRRVAELLWQNRQLHGGYNALLAENIALTREVARRRTQVEAHTSLSAPEDDGAWLRDNLLVTGCHQ